MERPVELSCTNCNKVFLRAAKEHRRQLNRGKSIFYCSLSCSCIQRNKDNPPIGNINNIPPDKRGRKKDNLSPFRWFISRSKYRTKRNKNTDKNYCDLTIQYLKQIWDSQNGVCPLTGWNLVLPQGTGKSFVDQDPINASLDRIDNNKGYIQGNVRFISFMANIARNTFSDEQLVEFCKAVVDKNK